MMGNGRGSNFNPQMQKNMMGMNLNMGMQHPMQMNMNMMPGMMGQQMNMMGGMGNLMQQGMPMNGQMQQGMNLSIPQGQGMHLNHQGNGGMNLQAGMNLANQSIGQGFNNSNQMNMQSNQNQGFELNQGLNIASNTSSPAGMRQSPQGASPPPTAQSSALDLGAENPSSITFDLNIGTL